MLLTLVSRINHRKHLIHRGETIKKTKVLLLAAAAIAIVSVAALPQSPALKADHLLTKVLVQGSPIHGANGIRFDDAGLLYIASAWGNEIVVMNALNGEILNRLGADKGVLTPDDLAFSLSPPAD
jgi:hypothetical protein